MLAIFSSITLSLAALWLTIVAFKAFAPGTMPTVVGANVPDLVFLAVLIALALAVRSDMLLGRIGG